MAQEKLNVVAIGPGDARTYSSATARMFASPKACVVWDSGTTFVLNAVVEYSGDIYRSLQASNVGNTPSSATAYWKKEILSIQDGDVCIVVDSSHSSMQQRVSGVWGSISGQPVIIPLVDGQISTADAFTYSGTFLPYAEIKYTIRRGSGHGSARQGTIVILNDGSGTFQYSHEFMDIGSDVQVTLVLSMVGSTFHVGYTSASMGAAVEMGYTLKGWQ